MVGMGGVLETQGDSVCCRDDGLCLLKLSHALNLQSLTSHPPLVAIDM